MPIREVAKASTELDKYCSRPRQNLIEAPNLTMTALKRYRVYDLLEQGRED